MTADPPPLVYGVWIPGQGWLRDRNGRQFADLHREYAKAAARMAGGGRVELIDDSMIALEPLFLEREQRRPARRLWSWIHVVLGNGRSN